MAKSKFRRNSKAKSKKFSTSIYQIHVKGPERNETLVELFDHVRNRLLHGKPLVKPDQFGNVVRALGAMPSRKPNAVELSIVKYNERRTGLLWNFTKEQLVADGGQTTAQKTELIIYPDEHRAVLVHRVHGPTPAQAVAYLTSLFRLSADEMKIECTIDVKPLKVKGAVKELKGWKRIKRFSIEVFRFNPDGTFRARRIAELVRASDADRAIVEVVAQIDSGIKKNGIKDLIDEGDRLVQAGQARIIATGDNAENVKDKIDSDQAQTQKFPVEAEGDDNRSLSTILHEKLARWFRV